MKAARLGSHSRGPRQRNFFTGLDGNLWLLFHMPKLPRQIKCSFQTLAPLPHSAPPRRRPAVPLSLPIWLSVPTHCAFYRWGGMARPAAGAGCGHRASGAAQPPARRLWRSSERRPARASGAAPPLARGLRPCGRPPASMNSTQHQYVLRIPISLASFVSSSSPFSPSTRICGGVGKWRQPERPIGGACRPPHSLACLSYRIAACLGARGEATTPAQGRHAQSSDCPTRCAASDRTAVQWARQRQPCHYQA
ncbi:hypothetical protein BS78_06G047900 [Paspalum vaginatum]|nr:hypothetical protein BS78_06G047900 [Paspalum vaginatum]